MTVKKNPDGSVTMSPDEWMPSNLRGKHTPPLSHRQEFEQAHELEDLQQQINVLQQQLKVAMGKAVYWRDAATGEARAIIEAGGGTPPREWLLPWEPE